uniref:polymorphic toxin type 50 domain-containing protein n=1 Tax=Tenacibaculum sp. TaxID=1906242 RepID=UPI003AA899F6
IYVYSKNDELETTDIVESKLDFSGKVLETKTTHKKSGNTDIVIVDTFNYDHMGRVLEQAQKINSQATETIASNVYDQLGQLKTKKVGGTLQEVDYSYNVRGWLKNINEDGKNDNDLFNFRINYNKPQNGATPLFNGNIAETSWNTLNTDTSTKTYSYKYDGLNRLLSAIDNTGEYSVGNLNPITYDKNGNILKMQRNRVIDADDNFTYTYNNTNKLQSLSGSKAGSFTYDINGNMKTSTRKGITNITYNHLNLPERIDIGSNRLENVYDALGTKLRKKKIENGVTVITDYAGGFIYENNELQFFSHPEGYVQKSGNSFSYVYQYKDHVGNVRLSYTDSNGNGIIDASTEIIEENHYYPFGLKQKGYNNVTQSTGNSLAQKWKYNGKELNEDLGLDLYDYGARFYDPELGRWFTPDALAEKYYNQSTYTYALNNPIIYVDPDGNQVEMCCDALKGFLATVVDNTIGTNLRNTFDTGSASYGTGVKSGHAVSQIAGVVLMADGAVNVGAGGAGLAGSGAVAATGVGAPVAGVTATASGGLILKGGAEIALGANMMNNASNNQAADGSKFDRGGGSESSGNSSVSSKINEGKQGKHIEGHNNYKTQLSNGKQPSILDSDAQNLLDSFKSGDVKGSSVINDVKTRVDFGQTIGRYYNTATKEFVETTNGIIHNSKSGAHIVPSAPN